MSQTYSPIFPHRVKPVHPGWYAASWCRGRLEGHRDSQYLCVVPTSTLWWYWDGRYWCCNESRLPTSIQARYWFGLVHPTPPQRASR